MASRPSRHCMRPDASKLQQANSSSDRSASPFSAGQPVSFKTNVNRAKTKKWVTAKKNAYDGDDWGEYDEYDEYGVDQQPEPAAPAQRYYAGAQHAQPARSFTDPSGPAPQTQRGRRHSFERGEEHRAFSASTSQPQPQYGTPQRQASDDYDTGFEPQGRRDFTPSAMPPPLQTRIAPVPIDVHVSPSNPVNAQFPPRKSSIGQGDMPADMSPRARTGSHSQSDKPLPFVRPADIYKRHEEQQRERERGSLDSSRPSMDSLGDIYSPPADGRSLHPLETVAERKSEYMPDYSAGFPPSGKQPAQSGTPQQLQQARFAQAEGASQPPAAPASHASVVSPGEQGLRSVVDQAFTRTDDQRSIPPTPISKDSDSISRTNTSSTTGISPIMSRVPSSTTSALKRNQAGTDGSTPAIAEEPHEPVSQPTSAFAPASSHPVVPTPFSNHARNFSSSSLPRSGLATPTRGDSPARSPVVTPKKDLPNPETAHVATQSPHFAQAVEGGLHGPSPAYATREADIADAMKTSDGRAVPSLSAAEKTSQDDFLESHTAQSPVDDVLPGSRSESPSKGRVQALAGRFGDVSHSRRGSTQSNVSRNSVQSWEKSNDHSRAASPTKGSPTKPSSPVKEFRPHLPGQWESYATTAMTPFDHGVVEKRLGYDDSSAATPQEEIELTPTTAKHPVTVLESASASDPIAALRNAGAAMAQSFKTTVGLDDPAPEPRDHQDGHPVGRTYGNVYMPRPLQMERTESSVSSIPPTPPAKNTPTAEHPPPLTPLTANVELPRHEKRPEFFPQLSTDPSLDDQESDRLRKEIVASLTPRTSEIPKLDPSHTTLQLSNSDAHRTSSILDSYWADGDDASPRPSHDTERDLPKTPTAATVPSTSESTEPLHPSMLNRFSWEANKSGAPAVPNGGTSVPDPTKATHEDHIPAPSVERAAEEERQQWSEGLPDTYFGPSHAFTVTKPDPVTEDELATRSSMPPDRPASPTSPIQEHARSSGLHVVNSAINPEAVDLPPRLSADHASPTRAGKDDIEQLQQKLDGEAANPAISPVTHVHESTGVISAQLPFVASHTTEKPLDEREIATITSATDRIATYNKTREHWATYDHGLQGWLSSALEANPDLATQLTIPVQRTSTGTMRHKHTGSLSLLGKFGGSSAQQSHAVEQYPSPVVGSSPTATAPSGPERRVASAQVQRELQAKGKDLLHTAGVLSGKGMTSAKGLFAKGKSRFGKDKVEK
jgi:hypothetical protein